MLKIIPLGGLGEIGLNMTVFEYGDTLIIVDAGLMFPEDYMLGIDIVIPLMDYIKDKPNINGIILTHAHEDHIGALPYLLKEVNIPIFASSFTLEVVKNKLEEHDLLSSALLKEVTPDTKLKLGSFDLEFIRVNHSTVDCFGIIINTPLGSIIHTGDFKITHDANDSIKTDTKKLALAGKKGVLALMSDSTNVEQEGFTSSDREVGKTLTNIAKNSSGRLIIALFASNLARIQQIINIAKAQNSKVIFSGRSVELIVKIGKELGYINIPDKMEIGIKKINQYPDNKIIIITTGSQGEPMSALTRMAYGAHKQIKVKKNDTVILSSKSIPGNEKAITNVINNLYKQGADVFYDKISKVHVSGHAFQEELKIMITLTNPQYFIPIHGEYRHLTHHARLAKQMGIPESNILLAENGQIIEFDENEGKITDSVTTGRILVDGKGIGDIGRSVLKERKILSEHGLVFVIMALDEETGIVIYGPELISKGFIFNGETGHLVDDAQCVILEIVEDISFEEKNRVDKIKARLKKDLKQYFYFAIKRRPVILPFIIEL